MNPFEMVVAIVITVSIASVLKSRYRAKHGIIADESGNESYVENSESGQVREEIAYLKDRVATLERIATDGREARQLENEIEKLRDS